MRLNHLSLCVRDLAEARALFQNCFDFTCIDQKGEAIAIMSDGHGFTLVLSSPRALKKELPPYPADFHVGFLVETHDQVDQAYQRLLHAEIQLQHQPRKIREGYGFYFTALNDLLFEVSCPL